jgi:type I restriction enzyme, S subunit
MKNWKTASLAELGTVTTGSTPQTSQAHYYGGDIPFVTPAELDQAEMITSTPRTLSTEGAKVARLLPPGAVLVCCIGSLGKVGMVGRSLATNQQINSIVFDEARVWPRYGFYACKLLKPKLEGMAPATTVAIVNKSKFEALEILVPPLNEQKRIAAILDQADEIRRLRQRAIDRLDELAQAIFYEMFGDPVSNPHGYKTEEMGSVADVRDGTHDSPKYVEDGYPLLTSKNFTSGKIVLEGASQISKQDFDNINKRSKVDLGDIVMPMIGTIGSPVIIEAEPHFAIKNVALIKMRGSHMESQYIKALLSGNFFRRKVAEQGRGGTQKFISLGDLRRLQIPVPPRDKQKEYSKRVSALRVVEDGYAEHYSGVEILFASLHQRAFQGEL